MIGWENACWGKGGTLILSDVPSTTKYIPVEQCHGAKGKSPSFTYGNENGIQGIKPGINKCIKISDLLGSRNVLGVISAVDQHWEGK